MPSETPAGIAEEQILVAAEPDGAAANQQTGAAKEKNGAGSLFLVTAKLGTGAGKLQTARLNPQGRARSF